MNIFRFLSIMYCIFLVNCINANQFATALETQTHNLQDAYNIYCTIPKKTSAIFFNMGLIAYHQQLYPKAIALWRISTLYTTIFNSYKIIKSSSFAMSFVKSEQKVPAEWSGHPMDSSQPMYHFLFLLCTYFDIIPLWIIQCLFILLSIYIAITVLMIGTNCHNIKKKPLYCAIASIGLFLSGYNIKVRTACYGITQEAVQLQQGPEDFFEPITQLSPLTELVVKAKKTSWYKVQYQNIVGWIPEQSLYIIDNNEICTIPIINRSQHY